MLGHRVQFVGFIRVLVIVARSHRGVHPVVDHILVVDHALEAPIDDRGARCNWPVLYRRGFR